MSPTPGSPPVCGWTPPFLGRVGGAGEQLECRARPGAGGPSPNIRLSLGVPGCLPPRPPPLWGWGRVGGGTGQCWGEPVSGQPAPWVGLGAGGTAQLVLLSGAWPLPLHRTPQLPGWATHGADERGSAPGGSAGQRSPATRVSCATWRESRGRPWARVPALALPCRALCGSHALPPPLLRPGGPLLFPAPKLPRVPRAAPLSPLRPRAARGCWEQAGAGPRPCEGWTSSSPAAAASVWPRRPSLGGPGPGPVPSRVLRGWHGLRISHRPPSHRPVPSPPAPQPCLPVVPPSAASGASGLL